MTNVMLPVTDKDECFHAFKAFRDQWAQGASVYENRFVGHRAGGYVCTLYWRPEERVWGVFEPHAPLNRFWICWGTEHPAGSFSITVETNPPLEGYDRRCSGVFLRDDQGRVNLGHSGRVGGGRKGIGKKAFLGYTDLKDRVLVLWPDAEYTEYLRLGWIGSDDLLAGIASFVHEVARFKDWAVGR